MAGDDFLDGGVVDVGGLLGSEGSDERGREGLWY